MFLAVTQCKTMALEKTNLPPNVSIVSVDRSNLNNDGIALLHSLAS